MKNLIYYIATALIIFSFSCSTESIEPAQECTYLGVIEDLTGLDGCGYLIRLSDGEYLEPVWRWGWCGTPPFPEGYEEDPLTNFDFVDGKQVRIGFKYAENQASICMKGTPAIIVCLEEIGDSPTLP